MPHEATTEEDCVVLIDADPDFGSPPLSVSFTSEVECTGGEVKYQWDFGDGTTSTEANPVHTYTKPGDYTATLTVTAGNVSASDEIDITVEEEEESGAVEPKDGD
jgi:PKD repeat protein